MSNTRENRAPVEISGLLWEAVIAEWAVDPCVPAIGLVPLPSRRMMLDAVLRSL